MIKGSEVRKADHEIEPILLDRWSPRAMSGEEISHEELMRLFEAARWAPSSFNAQQWRALYVRRGKEHWQTFFDLLVDANKAWAKNAVETASDTLRDLRIAEVVKMDVKVEDGKVREYRTRLQLSFKYGS
jgi:flavin-binding protein dodecin